MSNKITDINLIHIGFHKTASTLLQEIIFKENKNLNLLNSNIEKKDLWFYRHFINLSSHEFSKENFIKQFDKKFNLEINKNQNTKKLNILSDENLSGDPFSGIESYQLMNRIFDCFDNPKILIIIRNQLDMIISIYSNYINNGGTKSFEAWINGPETRWGMIFKKLNYVPLIRDYNQLFSEKNVKVVCYENLWNSEDGLVSLFKEFNINLNLENSKKSLNRGRSLFLNKIFAYLNFTENKFLKKFALRFLNNKPPLSDRKFVKKIIYDKFSKIILHNRELEKLLNLNLPKKYFD